MIIHKNHSTVLHFLQKHGSFLRKPETQNPETQNPETQNPETQNPETQFLWCRLVENLGLDTLCVSPVSKGLPEPALVVTGILQLKQLQGCRSS